MAPYSLVAIILCGIVTAVPASDVSDDVINNIWNEAESEQSSHIGKRSADADKDSSFWKRSDDQSDSAFWKRSDGDSESAWKSDEDVSDAFWKRNDGDLDTFWKRSPENNEMAFWKKNQGADSFWKRDGADSFWKRDGVDSFWKRGDGESDSFWKRGPESFWKRGGDFSNFWKRTQLPFHLGNILKTIHEQQSEATRKRAPFSQNGGFQKAERRRPKSLTMRPQFQPSGW